MQVERGDVFRKCKGEWAFYEILHVSAVHGDVIATEEGMVMPIICLDGTYTKDSFLSAANKVVLNAKG